jgi:hypothetical protein
MRPLASSWDASVEEKKIVDVTRKDHVSTWTRLGAVAGELVVVIPPKSPDTSLCVSCQVVMRAVGLEPTT